MADTTNANPSLGEIEFSFPLYDANEGRVFQFPIPIFFLWKVYSAINTSNWSDLHAIVDISGRMAHKMRDEDLPDPNQALIAVWTNLALGLSERDVLAAIEEPPKEDQVIGFTYLLLRARYITRAQAAGFAAGLLRKPVGEISPDAWRVKVDRWVKERGFPPVGIRKRKK